MRHRALLPALALIVVPTLAFGLGSRIPDQDAEASARGDAFTATADNASAIYYNPAGLTQLPEGFSIRTGVYAIDIQDKYQPLPGGSGKDSWNHSTLQSVPQIYLAYHPKNQIFTFGLGIYSPFGLKTEWPDDASFRQAGVYGGLHDIAFNPVVAIQVTRTLSVGLGISANYLSTDLRDGLTSAQGDSFEFKGDGLAVSGNVGIMWKPTEQHSFGLTYHTPMSGDFTGHTQTHLNSSEIRAAKAGNAAIAAGKAQLSQAIQKINSLPLPPAYKATLIAQANAQFAAQMAASGVPASGEFPTSFPTLPAKGTLKFPQYAVFGYSFRPTPDWNIEADIDWTDWDSVNDFILKQNGGATVKVPFDWTHSFMYELGATHLMGPWKLSLGFIYSENSVPSGTFNPLVPDSDRYLASLGIGRTFGQFSVDVAYQLGIGPKRTIVNDSPADGSYSYLSNAVSISLGYHF